MAENTATRAKQRQLTALSPVCRCTDAQRAVTPNPIHSQHELFKPWALSAMAALWLDDRRRRQQAAQS